MHHRRIHCESRAEAPDSEPPQRISRPDHYNPSQFTGSFSALNNEERRRRTGGLMYLSNEGKVQDINEILGWIVNELLVAEQGALRALWDQAENNPIQRDRREFRGAGSC